MASETSLASGLAGRYATALYELADEAKQLDAVAADLTRIRAMLDESEELRRMISSPLVSREAQARAMAAIMERAGAGDLTRRFIGTVARNRRLFALRGMVDAFRRILAARRGELTAQVTTARPLLAAQTEALANALRSAVGRKVTMDVRVDPKLIGGLTVKVGSRLVDASLASKLKRLQIAMKGLA